MIYKYLRYPQGYAFILVLALTLLFSMSYVSHTQLSADYTCRFGSVSCRISAQNGRTIAKEGHRSLNSVRNLINLIKHN